MAQKLGSVWVLRAKTDEEKVGVWFWGPGVQDSDQPTKTNSIHSAFKFLGKAEAMKVQGSKPEYHDATIIEVLMVTR